MTLLSLRHVKASYGASPALFDVSLDVKEGEAVALMGRNGMGKSTTIKTICRMLPAGGEIQFDGHDITRLPSHRVAQLGVGLVPEGRRCFASLTVMENLVAVARPGNWTLDTVASLFPRLRERKNQRAATLSGGEQQMLAIGRALMTNPRLLILDEATEGLAPLVRQEIWAALNALRHSTGMSFLIIDKSVSELGQLCDRVCILERGETVWDGAMADLSASIASRYIGI
ncbi:MAG: ABC transporter ATP-binding protein [Roseobacter sp.]